jgi:hypothetical protein
VTIQYRPPHAVVVGIIVTVLILLGVIVAMAGEDTSVVAKDDTVWVYPRIPSEEEKIEALKLAYILAGSSFSGGPMIDLSKPYMVPKVIQSVPVEPSPGVIPAKPEKRANADICQRHGRRKVVTGNSWRCVK